MPSIGSSDVHARYRQVFVNQMAARTTPRLMRLAMDSGVPSTAPWRPEAPSGWATGGFGQSMDDTSLETGVNDAEPGLEGREAPVLLDLGSGTVAEERGGGDESEGPRGRAKKLPMAEKVTFSEQDKASQKRAPGHPIKSWALARR